MKQWLVFLFCIPLIAAAQTEHWQFEDSLSGEGGTLRFEIYTAPGKYAVVQSFRDQVSRTVVDSAIRQRLDLIDNPEGHYFLRTMLEPPMAEEMETMEEMRPQVGREGLDFVLFPETKKLFGLTLRKVELIAPNPENEELPILLGDGWMLIGKTIPGMQEQVLSDGRTGVLVECVMHHGPDMHYQRLVGYSSGKTAPQGTFSLSIPKGYTDLNDVVEEGTQPVKSVVIEE